MEIDCREEKTAIKRTLLFNLSTGKEIDAKDADALIDGLELVERHIEQAIAQREVFRDAIRALAPKDVKTKTRRVRGERRCAKIEMPGEDQDNATLRAIATDPEYRLIWPQLIRVQSYAIKMREFKKAKATKGTEVWNKYRDRVAKAIKPSTSKPRVKIEE